MLTEGIAWSVHPLGRIDRGSPGIAGWLLSYLAPTAPIVGGSAGEGLCPGPRLETENEKYYVDYR